MCEKIDTRHALSLGITRLPSAMRSRFRLLVELMLEDVLQDVLELIFERLLTLKVTSQNQVNQLLEEKDTALNALTEVIRK